MFEGITAFNGGVGNRRFLSACQDLLELPIVSVDVGADGGVREWGELAALCESGIVKFDTRPTALVLSLLQVVKRSWSWFKGVNLA